MKTKKLNKNILKSFGLNNFYYFSINISVDNKQIIELNHI